MIFRYFPTIKALEEHGPKWIPINRFHFGRLLRIVLSFLLPVLFAFPASSQNQENAPGLDEPNMPETIAKPATVFYEHYNRRDPFLHIIPPKTASQNAQDEEMPHGVPPTSGIAGTFVDKAGVEGIVIRSGNRRVAIIRGADNRAYFLREGDRLFDGYLKTIEKDSVVFIRETLMRSGRTQTHEVTKRLRKS